MVIGVCSLEFYLPGCRSLKEKRAFLNRLKGRLKARFNVAVAEVEHQDLWQRCGVAVASVSTSKRLLEALFERVVREAEAHDAELLRHHIEYL